MRVGRQGQEARGIGNGGMGRSTKCNLNVSFVKEGLKRICRRKTTMNKIKERLVLCGNVIKRRDEGIYKLTCACTISKNFKVPELI